MPDHSAERLSADTVELISLIGGLNCTVMRRHYTEIESSCRHSHNGAGSLFSKNDLRRLISFAFLVASAVKIIGITEIAMQVLEMIERPLKTELLWSVEVRLRPDVGSHKWEFPAVVLFKSAAIAFCRWRYAFVLLCAAIPESVSFFRPERGSASSEELQTMETLSFLPVCWIHRFCNLWSKIVGCFLWERVDSVHSGNHIALLRGPAECMITASSERYICP